MLNIDEAKRYDGKSKTYSYLLSTICTTQTWVYFFTCQYSSIAMQEGGSSSSLYPDTQRRRRRIDLESRNGIGTHDSVVMGRMCVELLWLAGLGNATCDHYRGQLTRPSAGRSHRRRRRSGEIKYIGQNIHFAILAENSFMYGNNMIAFFLHTERTTNRIVKLIVQQIVRDHNIFRSNLKIL